MKRSIVFSFFGILILLMLTFSCDNIESHKPEDRNNYYFLTTEEYDKIQDGDVVMRQGYGIVSTIILETLREEVPISHIGVISEDSKGNYYVIHSVSRSISPHDGIQIDKLENFINQSRPNSVLISRYGKAIEDSDFGKKISKRARYYLDKQIPFDHTFNLEDSTSFFCSELVWRILVDLFDDDVFDRYPTDNLREKLKFEPFYDSTRFEIVINHHKRND